MHNYEMALILRFGSMYAASDAFILNNQRGGGTYAFTKEEAYLIGAFAAKYLS